jgi:transposase-like protein
MSAYENGYRNTDQRKYPAKTKVSEFIIDETLIKVGFDLIWLWVAIEPKHRKILHIDISFERDMLIAEHYISSSINKYDRYPVSTDGGIWYPPQVGHFLKLKHHLHPHFEKGSFIERTLCNISKIEPNNALMTIFHTKEKRNVN